MLYSFGDTIYAVGKFDHGDTVTVQVINATSDTVVSTGNAVELTAVQGYFKFTYAPTSTSETVFIFVMDNGKYTVSGMLVFGGEMNTTVNNTKTSVDTIDTTTADTNNVVNNNLATKSDVINAALL